MHDQYTVRNSHDTVTVTGENLLILARYCIYKKLLTIKLHQNFRKMYKKMTAKMSWTKTISPCSFFNYKNFKKIRSRTWVNLGESSRTWVNVHERSERSRTSFMKDVMIAHDCTYFLSSSVKLKFSYIKYNSIFALLLCIYKK